MTLRTALWAMAAALLLSVTACGPVSVSLETEGTQTQRDPDEWVNQQFSGERWGGPDVHRAAGEIGPGSDGGLEFTPEKAGWYDIGMVCEGASSITVTVAAADDELGTGSTDCGSAVTTTMELPASKVSIAAEGTGSGMWAVAIALAEAPQP
ncbi:hypothetical protein [Arthrobacter sp. Marseille-P9274]|uniref:hypothetical protein n=1 Tax=Arthrobacter sp. Marseille-P9274 TaxID=2866572 RepID=UPI0021C76101|nr:hypothetical protein [Arthrobacter sp. Marseille-P9274]